MSTDVNITYVNNSESTDKPTIFVFSKNVAPTFDVLKHGVAWRVMPNIGKGSSSSFIFPINTTVQATWGDGNRTAMLDAVAGKRYIVEEDNTGIVIKQEGQASQPGAIEVKNLIHVPGGIHAQVCKDGKVFMNIGIVAYDQTAVFVIHPKLYWGMASEIEEGQSISSVVLDTDDFFEQDLMGVTSATVTLIGNPREGYRFLVENE